MIAAPTPRTGRTSARARDAAATVQCRARRAREGFASLPGRGIADRRAGLEGAETPPPHVGGARYVQIWAGSAYVGQSRFLLASGSPACLFISPSESLSPPRPRRRLARLPSVGPRPAALTVFLASAVAHERRSTPFVCRSPKKTSLKMAARGCFNCGGCKCMLFRSSLMHDYARCATGCPDLFHSANAPL